MAKTLVVAFDGMDKELIEEFDLENIPQEEFGSIDNDTGVKRRMTSELFASFITGETHEVHGVTGLSKYESIWKEKLVKSRVLDYVSNNVRGGWRFKKTLKTALQPEESAYTKDDIQCDTIFDQIEMSLALNIPSYNPDAYWQTGLPHKFLENIEKPRKHIRNETQRRLRLGNGKQPAFFDLNFELWDFIMLHLHDPDPFQDAFLGNLKQEYERLDRIAGEIIRETPDNWNIIFMSDHGRMLEDTFEHNTNAFYSSNIEFDGVNTLSVTDFFDILINLN